MPDFSSSQTPAAITPDRWGRVASVFDEAFALEKAEREAFLARECSDDPVLRSEVERMLRSADAPGAFFDTSVLEKPDVPIPDALVPDVPVPDAPIPDTLVPDTLVPDARIADATDAPQGPSIAVGDRGGTFGQRNKILIVVGAALVAATIAGAAATAWQLRTVREQTARTEQHLSDLRTRGNAVLLAYLDAFVTLPASASASVRERVVADGLAYLDAVAADSSADASQRLDLAEAYRRLAAVQGGGSTDSLRRSAAAMASYRKAIALLEPMLTAEASPPGLRTTLASALAERGLLLWKAGNLPAARAAMTRANALDGAVSTEAARDTAIATMRNHRHDDLGQVLRAMGKAGDARSEFYAALAALDAVPEPHRSAIAIRRAYAVTLHHLADVMTDAGEHDAALRSDRRALELHKAVAAADPRDVASQRALALSYRDVGRHLAKLGQYAEAAEHYRRELDITRALLRTDAVNALVRGDVEDALARLGDMATKAGNAEEALRYYSASRDMQVQDLARDSTDLRTRAAAITAQVKLAATHARLGHTPDALAQLSRTEATMARTTLDSADAQTRSLFAETYAGLAESYIELRRQVGAEGLAEGICRNAGRMFDKAESGLTELVARKLASQADSTRLSSTRTARTVARRECPAL